MAYEFVPKLRRLQLSWSDLSSMETENDFNGEKEPLRRAENGAPLRYQQSEQDKGLPIWCSIDLDELDRRRSALAKAIFGPTPQNRQHALYFFGRDGPAFH